MVRVEVLVGGVATNRIEAMREFRGLYHVSPKPLQEEESKDHKRLDDKEKEKSMLATLGAKGASLEAVPAERSALLLFFLMQRESLHVSRQQKGSASFHESLLGHPPSLSRCVAAG